MINKVIVAMRKLSLITIHLNDLQGLVRTLDSIEVQAGLAVEEIEWIVIDGKTAGFEESEAFAKVKAKANVLISENDKGIYDAMNKGIQFATGRYCLFLNAGDVLGEFDTLAKILNHLCKNDLDVIFGAAWEGTTLESMRLKRCRDLHYISYGLPTHHQAIVMRTDLVRHFGFRTDMKIASDYLLVAQVLKMKGIRTAIIDSPICKFFFGGISTKAYWAGLKEQKIVRREVLGLNLVACTKIVVFKFATKMLKDITPRLYSLLRYSR
ncbi:glycosyltransferase [Oxalobacteraceae bacterium R-40]|uniref:Glycosyltransferase n=1 Tax=Keguizhuia sedimenti TaxID=3064264 RepID=A0ABU1BN88_9BURK|nr:glycosyltransferase [Oxalobacteraceae bacterium R-40]